MSKDQNKFITKTREQLYDMFMNSLKEDSGSGEGSADFISGDKRC